MKEFIRTLKQMYLVSWSDMLGYVMLSVFGGMVGIIISLIIPALDGSAEEYAQFGAFMALLIGLIIYVFVGSMGIEQEFNLAISMGKVRRYFVPAKYLLQVFNIAILLVSVMVTGYMEDILYPAIYPDWVCGFSVNNVLSEPMVFLMATFGGAALVLLFGALVLKFTTKVFGIIVILWAIFFMTLARIAEAMDMQQNSIWRTIGQQCLDFIENLSIVQCVLIAFSVIVAKLIVAFVLLAKQRVTR